MTLDNALVLYLNFRIEPVASRRGDTVELLRKQMFCGLAIWGQGEENSRMVQVSALDGGSHH